MNRRNFLIELSGAGCSVPFILNSAFLSDAKQVKNLIFIICDTLRADYLGCYGNPWVQTPNIDKLARESILFTDCYAEGLPTIPARRTFFTGKSTLPDSAWCPLKNPHTTLPSILTENKFLTGFITDVYHYFIPGMNFHHGFRSFQWVRGQEEDRWKPGPRDLSTDLYIPKHHRNQSYHYAMLQYVMNTRHWKSEEDYFCSQVCDLGIQWLENHCCNQPFFLCIDMYDPHEPWDAPKRFKDIYRKNYPLERYLFGYGVDWQDIRDEDIPILKDLYAAEVSFVDHTLGKLFAYLEANNFMENTAIVFTSDHGTHLGEKGCVQKRPELLNSAVMKIPLIIYHPNASYAGIRNNELVSALDIAPTCLDLLGYPAHPNMNGKSMWNTAVLQNIDARDDVVSVFHNFAAIRTKEWHYFQHTKGNDKGFGPCLYNLVEDPTEQKNVIQDFPDIARKMRYRLENHLQKKLPK